MQVRCDDVAPQPWRNGGGQTRELLAWPTVDDWRLRISVADIEADGPFSVFDGVTRWMTVVTGAGVRLRFGDREHRLALGDSPLRFDGDEAPQCQLIAGAARDLNLMARGGRSVMRAVEAGTAWDDGYAMRAIFTAEPGQWTDGIDARELPAMSLLWLDQPTATRWVFTFDDVQSTTRAWWLGFSA